MSEWNSRVSIVTCTPLAKMTGPGGALIYKPVSPLWHRARMGLSYGTNINMSEMCADGLEVGDARSRIAASCLEKVPQPLFLFFLDSDVIVPADAVTKLFYWMKTRPEVDVACGIYVVKGQAPFDPLIYRDNGEGAYWDWAVGDILTTKEHGIRACHMGLTMIRVSLFQRMKEAGLVGGDGADQGDEPFFCTEVKQVEGKDGPANYRGTEDIFFAIKARKLDAQFLVDTSVLAGHIDESTGVVYGLPGNTTPIERAMWLPVPDGSRRRRDRVEAEANEAECDECKGGSEEYYNTEARFRDAPCLKCRGTGKIKAPLKLAIDLGAGETREQRPGYRFYTLDARKNSQADYCQQLPRLNFPDDHYDLCYSSHTFEHVGRWQQELLWSETYRICKPGGLVEIIVPNVEWAARKIAAGEVDTHVMNVLYGNQEAEEAMGVEWNHHLFGFVPNVMKALAEQAGFVDVTVTTYEQEPGLTYHMVLKGQKPETNVLIETEATPVQQEQPTNGDRNTKGGARSDLQRACVLHGNGQGTPVRAV